MDELKDRIRALLAARGGRAASLGELLSALGLGPSDRKRLRRLMRELAAEGDVARMRGRQYMVARQTKTVVGILRASPKGFGFVVPEDDYIHGSERREIFVPRKYMSDAMNRDKVRVRVLGETSRSPEGEVLEVLERGTSQIVGTFYHTRHGGQVIPRDEHITRTIVTPRPDPALALENGVYVVAEITGWTPMTQPLLGRVIEALGDPDTPGIDVTMVLRDAGVDPEFSAAAMAEADAIPSGLSGAELTQRSDFRHLVTFTMDGANAKDFDDALSIERLDHGMWRLGVHIADVSHYVVENGALDQDAVDRATSIYPVDRVVPMLPERLSNDLCSLRPNVDRPTLSCVMDIDDNGHVHGYSIHESVIHSRHRLVYEDVQALIDGRAGPELIRQIGDIRPELDELYLLRCALTSMRIRRGALDLDIPETEVEFNPDGTVRGLERRARLESHRVVEECMLIANEVVATHLFNLHVPSLYRIHEEPDRDKLKRILPVLGYLGVRLPAKTGLSPEGIQAALASASESERGVIARRLILQAMMRACYSDENAGHYGLASRCYTHFTSPIRRYPDLVVHRLLKETKRGGARCSGTYAPLDETTWMTLSADVGAMPTCLHPQRTEYLRAKLPDLAKHCSERERRAEEIERQATDVKALEYMRRFLGEEFEGFVTAVLNYGFFVELRELPVSGLVHVRSLDDDFYEYDHERMLLAGKQSGTTIKLGDSVRIAVHAVNVATREMDFALVEKRVRPGSAEKRVELHRERQRRAERHAARRPRTGGFQARGARRRR